MKCPICKNDQTRFDKVTVTLERGGLTIVFKDVPAQVCTNCGEQFVDEASTAELLKQATAAAKAGVQVEVRSYAA